MKAPKLAAIVCAAALSVGTTTSALAETARVAVSQIVEHPALDAARNGLLDGLIAKGYTQGENLDFKYQTAQGNPAIAVQIARQYVGEQPDVLVGIATPSAQALAAATRDVPVIFTAVTDPVGAKLVKNMDAPSGNVTGLSDLSPVAQHVALAKELLPNLSSIGVVYNPGEANAVTLVELLKEAAQQHGIKVVEGTALKSADVQSAAQVVATQSDVIYAPTDNTVASAIDGLVAAANSAGKPVIGGSTSYIPNGAVVALGFDYYSVGVQTADYVAAVLEGKPISSLPAKVAEGSDLAVNRAAAKKLGLEVPASILDRASRIVD
ncbi:MULTISPECIES: ABC transporter substrate-binding protein [unclassified Salinivibrio]|uniref:ABC transporter substrate-binding protein n=1 Tax=unclassified Salinivibrio TaxID=2636825 RepID=UPI00128B2271|nr:MULTISPECIES: ABC transporter substrate-binding protein [unclassified Salinivibrio]MPS30766.1 ABC transporter substrate-binding protein [Salinivibrio sp. VYel7]MPX92167.1 ABC transporter substrate-binding protein [Salinivibrio sp. VYel9]MPX97453.1 ABC transporter substrate-binding protein [Salinivibrio sp. VYel6]MPX98399.1 ABC transporter substrate-binding protein [Salinivibrio sp. VYel4]MPY01900.1 ABC transporter substrate-binding protein [Salinivibrio sp. VYel5]